MSGTASDSLVKPPSSTSAVRFAYDGPVQTLPTLPVLRREANLSLPTGSLATLTRGANWLNLSSFKQLAADSISLTDGTTDGYTMTIDYRHGLASMYRFSSTTTTTKTETTTGQLSNAEAIAIAAAFLSKHGISTNNTADPQVLDTGIAYATDLALPTRGFTPYTTVVWPWVINGIPVVDQSGNVYGLQVTVDVTARSVASVANITDLRFTGSDYPLLSSWATVLDYASRGGLYPLYAGLGKTTTVALTAPRTVYMVSSYQLSNDGLDYLVPSLLFPIGQVPEGTAVYQQNVVVPLVETLYSTATPEPDVIEPSSGSGSSSSGTTTPASE